MRVPRHTKCEKFLPSHRNRRRCSYCGKVQFQVARGDWRPSLTVKQFAERWLPAISGTKPDRMMVIEVAFPFEWNCYESWNTVMRVRFDFTDVLARRQHGMGTATDIMNGWRSDWHEDLCHIDYKANQYFEERVGRDRRPWSDNLYPAMRDIVER